MSRRNRFTKKPNTTFALNINSMTDMFTIMLVFLLQTYSTNSYEVKPQKGIVMPASVSDKTAEDAPMVALSKDTLSLNEKTLPVKVTDFIFAAESLDQGEIIKPLLAELQILKNLKKEKDEIILQIDKACPYPNLKKILSTVSVAGFIKVRLASIAAN